jgi:putative transposase
LAAQLKQVYQAVSADAAEAALSAFEQGPYGIKCPPIAQAWRRQWAQVVPFFAFPPEVRKLIYTTNAIESLNSVIRCAVAHRKLFPSDESAMKVIYLAISQAAKKWTMPIQNWRMALNRFMIQFEERIQKYAH